MHAASTLRIFRLDGLRQRTYTDAVLEDGQRRLTENAHWDRLDSVVPNRAVVLNLVRSDAWDLDMAGALPGSQDGVCSIIGESMTARCEC